jgi:hypothetical protein
MKKKDSATKANFKNFISCLTLLARANLFLETKKGENSFWLGLFSFSKEKRYRGNGNDDDCSGDGYVHFSGTACAWRGRRR